MLVISDASPLNILVRIGHIDVLPKLFQTVLIPPAVQRELSQAETPQVVRDWLATNPTWLEVRAPTYIDNTVSRDPGEREAISLACETKPDAILLDDLHARRQATRLGLTVIGTLRVLDFAAERRLLSLPDAIEKLRRTDFRISDELIKQALEHDAKRHTKQEHERTASQEKERVSPAEEGRARERNRDRER